MLPLFVWIFYIGGGIFGLWNLFQKIHGLQFNVIWDSFYVLINLFYVIGGLYFVSNINSLLPKYRVRIIQVITGLFLINLAETIVTGILILNPAYIDPSLGSISIGTPGVLSGLIGGYFFSFAISLTIYLAIINEINKISGVVTGQRRNMTIIYWIVAIVLLVPIAALVYILS